MLSRFAFTAVVVIGVIGGHIARPSAAADKPSELPQLIANLLSNPDREFRAAGLDQVRTGAKGTSSTLFFAAQLAKLDPSAQAALLGALAERGDSVAKPEIAKLLESSDKEEVRVAAIAALGKLGDASDLPNLVQRLEGKSDAERNAAKGSLVQLKGESVSAKLGTEASKVAPGTKVILLDVLATRRARDQWQVLVAAALDDNGGVRSAAMGALGRIGQPAQLSEMLPGVLKAERGGERDAAERNIVQVCQRIENEDQRGEAVIQALKKQKKDQANQLLPLVGRVGGKKLIDFVVAIANESDPARRKLGIDALSKWPDASVADKLLEITNAATEPAERSQAFQGYVRVSALRDQRNDQQRLDRMKQAMQLAKTPEEQSYVINRCRTAYSVETVRYVLPYTEQKAFSQVAAETIVEIAHHRDVRDRNKAEFDKALDQVIAVSKDPVVVDRAGRYKRGETWNRPRPE